MLVRLIDRARPSGFSSRLLCLHFPVLRHRFLRHARRIIYNITRNVTFVAIIALGMTMVIITGGIDLSVGSVLCLCSMVLAVIMHAGYSIEVGIAASRS